jgi:hypothetical protein
LSIGRRRIIILTLSSSIADEDYFVGLFEIGFITNNILIKLKIIIVYIDLFEFIIIDS